MNAATLTRESIVADFRARADQHEAAANTAPAVGRRYVVRTSPGLYLKPSENGVHRVGGVAMAEVFSSPEAQAIARDLRESDQDCAPVVTLISAALKHEAAELRRLADTLQAL